MKTNLRERPHTQNNTYILTVSVGNWIDYPTLGGGNLNFDGCGPGGGGGSKKWSYIVDVINGWPFNTNL